jgi:O-acetyl-ADP-ribose deacetylase (regulator of RNase III)
MGVNLITGDITTLQADAVVNVINYELEDGGFLNQAIHTAAGPELKAYCEMTGACPVGGARLTPGFNLPAGYIIHTVAPLWREGKEQEEKWLAACYQRSLELAAKYNCRKVAIPVFSAGYSGFPFGKAFQIAYDTCCYCLTEKNMAADILLVLYARDLRCNVHSERAAAMFNTVAEYVKTHHQLEEEKISILRLAEGARPYFPERAHYSRKIIMPDGATMIVFPQGANVQFSVRSLPPEPKSMPDKEEFVPEASFTKKLLRYMDAKNMTAPAVYSDAGYDRKLFSKIQSDPDYHPRKYTVVRFALALKLDPEETEDLLNAAGFALSRSMLADLVIAYCITNDMRSVAEVNNILESWGLETI